MISSTKARAPAQVRPSRVHVVALGIPASGGGIERVFTAAGKQHDDLKKKTMDKTLSSTLKAGLHTKLPTCDAEGVFHDDEGTYKNRK